MMNICIAARTSLLNNITLVFIPVGKENNGLKLREFNKIIHSNENGADHNAYISARLVPTEYRGMRVRGGGGVSILS